MFKDKTFLYEVNPMIKIMGLILFFATIVFAQYGWYLTIISLTLILLTDEYPCLNKIAYLSLGIGVLSIVYSPIMWINKLLCSIIYVGLLLKIVKMEQIKYLIEMCFYQLKINKLTNFFIRVAYFIRLWKKNYINLFEISNSYGININMKLKGWIIRESFKVAKRDINDIMVLYKLRFYNLYPIRTEVESRKWEKWDTNYFMVHLLLLIITVILGR